MRIPKISAWLTLCVASLALVACGGGTTTGSGNSLYNTGGSTNTGGTTTTPTTTGGTGSVTTSNVGSVVLAMGSNTISASTPGTVTAQVKDASGNPIANTIVTFAISNLSATVSPLTVKTDANGNASASVQPVAGSLGAAYVNALADVPGSTTVLSARTAFTVSSVTTSLGAMTASPTTVSAYGSSVLSVNVVGASSGSPVTVAFSSTCASGGKAILSPATVTVTGTTASITYQDKACASTDRVNASIVGTSQTALADLTVQAPVAQALEFVSTSSPTICLSGSGCPESSVVSFRLKDIFGAPISGADVAFALDIANVASLSFTSTKTDATGLATVSVKAKNIPTPIRVRATSAGGLSTVSNALAINAGLPTQRGMSFSATPYNVDGLLKDGTESLLRLQLNDRFGNPVPDGTAISLVTEGASVIPASCQTLSGVCSVKFISSNYRPLNGRITVTAFAMGEESFDDLNGDNVYTVGENFIDMGEIFIDKNEDKAMNPGEYVIGAVPDAIWNSNTYVRASRIFILSDSDGAPRLFQADAAGNCTNVPFVPLVFTMGGVGAARQCRVQQQLCIRDSNVAADALGGNPIPAGAVLTLTTKANGAAAVIDQSPIPETISPTRHIVTADLSDCAKDLLAPGSLDLMIAMPKGGATHHFTIGKIQ